MLFKFAVFNFKNRAFTLAEVLITLGIIGVVAAMTIPNLISNVHGTRYRSQLKKSVSSLSQAARLNKANYGWDFAGISNKCNDVVDGKTYAAHHPETAYSMCALLNGNLSVKNKVTNSHPLNGPFVGIVNATAYNIYHMADGTVVGFRGAVMSNKCELPIGTVLKNPKSQLDGCRGFIDVNGLSLPNAEVKCSIGTTSNDITTSCIVKNKDIKDVFPVVFYNDIVGPGTNATRYVLESTK